MVEQSYASCAMNGSLSPKRGRTIAKVIWPTRKQMITYTSVVLVFLAVMVALIYGMDIGLQRGVLWLFG